MFVSLILLYEHIEKHGIETIKKFLNNDQSDYIVKTRLETLFKLSNVLYISDVRHLINTTIDLHYSIDKNKSSL